MKQTNKAYGHGRRRQGHPVLKWTLISLLGILIAGMIAGTAFVIVQISRAPDLSEIDAAPDGYLTVILDSDGNQMDSLHVTESNRIYVTLDQTPEDLQNAFVSIEDARFWKHHGIDLRGIVRAAVKGVTTGNFSEGASTITQQLLKNNVFTGWMEEETFMDKLSRKVQEQYLAVRLESKYSKEWILESYMNTINLGGGTRGVQVAAQYYFGKDVSQLTLAQCALIAGITKNPSGYNPLTHPEESLQRQQLVLASMEREGYITAEERSAALSEDVLSELVTDHSDSAQVFNWFEDELLTGIVSDLENVYGLTEEEAWDKLYTGGLTICSTEDPSLQQICENAVLNGGFLQNGEEVSVVMTRVSDGSVAAIIGGSEVKTASLVYNRAADSVRQPGSTIKIIGEYAAALEKGSITLGTVMDDCPTTYSDGTEIRNASGSYEGRMTVDQAISDSCNTIALKTYQQVGQSAVLSSLQRFGITTLDENDYYESLSIGGTYNGVTNLELTAAYNAIADGGTYVAPYYYTQVLDHDGNVILSHSDSGTRAVTSTTADLLTIAMEDVMTEGTGTTANISTARVAGKSGTTNDKRDLWFVGFSSDYTCGVWGGYDDNAEQQNSSYVKKLWSAIMESASQQNGSTAELVNTNNYTAVTICTKCGRLAVDGLCDDTVQGDMTRTVYYIPGTEPTTSCTCHKELTICSVSGGLATMWCPTADRETEVYLLTGTEGTADEEACIDQAKQTTCTEHTSVLDLITGDKKDTDEDTDKDTGSSTGTGTGTDTQPDYSSGYGGSYGGYDYDSGSGYGQDSGGWGSSFHDFFSQFFNW